MQHLFSNRRMIKTMLILKVLIRSQHDDIYNMEGVCFLIFFLNTSISTFP